MVISEVLLTFHTKKRRSNIPFLSGHQRLPDKAPLRYRNRPFRATARVISANRVFPSRQQASPGQTSDIPLGKHGIGDTGETGDIGTTDIVDIVTILSVLEAFSMDPLHDPDQIVIDILEAPGESLGVLGHLEARDGNPAGIGGFSGSKGDIVEPELTHSSVCTGHICALCHTADAVGDQSQSLLFANFILCSTGQGDVTGDVPGAAFSKICTKLGGVVTDAASSLILVLPDPLDLAFINALRVVDVTIRI